MSYLVSIVDREDPVRRDATPAVQTRKDRLLGLWRAHIGPVAEGGEGDYEDFWEQAVRLDAAITGFGAENIWLTRSSDRDTAVHLVTGERKAVAELEHLPKYGAQASRRHQFVQQEQALLADKYWRYEAFLSRAGRRFEIGGFAADGCKDIRDILAGYAADGIGRAFVKANLNKFAAFPVDLREGTDVDEARGLLSEEMGWTLVYLEGVPDIFQVQEFVTMEYEYRVFVVDQRAVTGAGCVEEHTPLDNNGYAFDDKLRRSRSEMSDVVPEPAITGILTGFARQAIEDLAREVPALTDYVIDVAMGANGKPLVVELNALLNSGLYASAPDRVTRDMAARNRRPGVLTRAATLMPPAHTLRRRRIRFGA